MEHFETPVLRGAYRLRPATEDDVEPIVALLAADQLRAPTERTDPAAMGPYHRAFRAITDDPGQLLVVAVDRAGRVVATMQLTFIPGLARAGTTRLQLEAVRVEAALRSNGLGRAMVEWALAEGRRRGAGLAQLTSDQSRTSAHRFYERLGFEQSHLGFKLLL